MVTIHMRAVGASKQRAICDSGRYRYLYQMTRVPEQVTCRRCHKAAERRSRRAVAQG